MVRINGHDIEQMDAAYALGVEYAARIWPRLAHPNEARRAAEKAYDRASPADRGFNRITFVIVFVHGWADKEQELWDQRRAER